MDLSTFIKPNFSISILKPLKQSVNMLIPCLKDSLDDNYESIYAFYMKTRNYLFPKESSLNYTKEGFTIVSY